ncbi:MAG: hypothetical protein ABI113_14825 [Mucilaginibacter sp.]
MTVIKVIQSAPFLTAVMVISAIAYAVLPAFAKQKLISREPKHLRNSNRHKRVDPVLYWMIIFLIIGGLAGYYKDQSTSNDKQDIIGAIDKAGYKYSEMNKSLILTAIKPASQSRKPAKLPIQSPHIRVSYPAYFSDTSFDLRTKLYHSSIYVPLTNIGSGPAKHLVISGFLLLKSKFGNKTIPSTTKPLYDFLEPKGTVAFYIPGILQRLPSGNDTLFVYLKLSYRNEKNIPMPVQIICLLTTPDDKGAFFLSVEDEVSAITKLVNKTK